METIYQKLYKKQQSTNFSFTGNREREPTTTTLQGAYDYWPRARFLRCRSHLPFTFPSPTFTTRTTTPPTTILYRKRIFKESHTITTSGRRSSLFKLGRPSHKRNKFMEVCQPLVSKTLTHIKPCSWNDPFQNRVQPH